MSAKKILGIVLKIPLILLNISTLGVGIYAAMGNIPGFLISWGAPAIIGAMQLAYIAGVVLLNKHSKEISEQTQYAGSDQDSGEIYSTEEYNPEQQ